VRANAGAALPADVKNASHHITRSVMRIWRSSPSSRRRAPRVREVDLSLTPRADQTLSPVAQPLAEIVPGLRARPPCSRSAIVSSGVVQPSLGVMGSAAGGTLDEGVAASALRAQQSPASSDFGSSDRSRQQGTVNRAVGSLSNTGQ
jgi:hypothetical protein